ncbi:MAG: hypothetical protein L0H38_00665 [bacterium]|nr:hypothetical protein [bacterium]
MAPDKQKPDDELDKTDDKSQSAPADALSRSPDDLAEEQAASSASSEIDAEEAAAKKPSPLKRFLKKINIYLLFFGLVFVTASAFAVVNYLNSQKVAPAPDIATQKLTEDTLKDLASSDVSIGDNSQTLSIRGNADISGQTLIRGDLNVAGNIQAGGRLSAPSLTISGATNLGDSQIKSLKVDGSLAIQGETTLQGLSVAGSSAFNGPMTASQITTSNLTLSGNAKLTVPNHISFTGPSPSRTKGDALGNGGSVSISGSDTSGSVNVRTGSSAKAGCFIHVNFRSAFSSTPHVIATPINSAAGDIGYYVKRSTTGFNICATNPPSNKSFGFDYFVAG